MVSGNRWFRRRRYRYRKRRLDWHCEQRESPDPFGSGASLRSSVASLPAVLTSSAFAERVAPFIPTRVGY
jgi:hypothetical protein